MNFLLSFLMTIVLSLAPCLCMANQEGAPWASMVTSTSAGEGLPFNVYSGKKWSSEKGARFVKLHTHLDQPVSVSKIEVESCGEPWTGIGTVFINFDDVRLESEPRGSAHYGKPIGKKLVFDFSGEAGNVVQWLAHSITLNFEKNVGPCISSIRLFDGAGKEVLLNVPVVVKGTAEVSSTLSPKDSYDVMNLFDSRFEYAWASDRLAKGVTFSFQFDREERIESIKLWNGYQRSGVHCYSNSRVKEMQVLIDGALSETLSVKDEMGPQVLALKKPVKTKGLKLVCSKAYPGKTYQDLVLSEMRFFNGKDWFMLDPMPRAKQVAAANHAKFKGAGLGKVLNESLIREDAVAGYEDKVTKWLFRFRPDGSFFMNSNVFWGDSLESGYYALGNYEVKSSASGGLQLRIFGLLRKSYYGESDCNGCGRDCNEQEEDGESYSIFQDFISITKKGEAYLVSNQGKKKKIVFDVLEMKHED